MASSWPFDHSLLAGGIGPAAIEVNVCFAEDVARGAIQCGMGHDRAQQNVIFDAAPWLYDRYRPGYPTAAVEAFLELAELRSGSRVLEIGAGTGQLTMPLVRRGIAVTALEPGPRMAAILSHRLEEYADARVIGSRFEEADVGRASFDAVVAATAFHWIDPVARYQRAAAVLRPGGALALLRNDHALSDSSAAYYLGARPIYERLAPEIGPPFQPPLEQDVPSLRDEMAASGLFELIDERRFGWNRAFTSSELIGLLRTYSNHRALGAPARKALLEAIRTFVEDQLGGRFVDRYVTTVCVGRRVA